MGVTRIIDLSQASALAAGDQVPIYQSANGDARRTSITALAALIQTLLTVPGDPLKQYAAPSATGFTVTIAPVVAGGSVRLVLTPTGTLAAGTITLPGATGTYIAASEQEVEVVCTQVITTLTVSATGLTVTGAPTTLAANQVFKMRYDAVLLTWFVAT